MDHMTALVGLSLILAMLYICSRDVVVPIQSQTPYGLEENRLFLAIRPYGHIFVESVTDD